MSIIGAAGASAFMLAVTCACAPSIDEARTNMQTAGIDSHGSLGLPREPGDLRPLPTEPAPNRPTSTSTVRDAVAFDDAPPTTPDDTSPPQPTTTATASPPCQTWHVLGDGFAPDDATLPSPVLAQLDRIVPDLVRDVTRYASILVIGHADARPTPIGNDRLALLRAEAVAVLLETAGVPEAMLIVEGRGDREPLDSRSLPEAWAANRRIEIRATCAT